MSKNIVLKDIILKLLDQIFCYFHLLFFFSPDYKLQYTSFTPFERKLTFWRYYYPIQPISLSNCKIIPLKSLSFFFLLTFLLLLIGNPLIWFDSMTLIDDFTFNFSRTKLQLDILSIWLQWNAKEYKPQSIPFVCCCNGNTVALIVSILQCMIEHICLCTWWLIFPLHILSHNENFTR